MQPKTRCHPVLVLAGVLLIAMTAGCASVPDDSPLPAAPDEPYTLRIVFSGLVPLVYDTKTTTPDSLVALVPNLARPHHLALGKMADKHRNRLLFDRSQVLVDAGGRKVQPKGWTCDCLEEGDDWDYVSLENEHLELLAPGRLEVVSGPINRPKPCNPAAPDCPVKDRSIEDQERDIEWVLDLDDVTKSLAMKDRTPPRLRRDLLEPTYSAEMPLISARYVFPAGRLQTRWLIRDGGECSGPYLRHTIEPAESSASNLFALDQALARDVELVVEMKGPAVLRARSLATGRPVPDRRAIVIHPRPGQTEVTLHIDNHPAMASCEAMKDHMTAMVNHALTHERHVGQLHFLTLYNLLDDPAALPSPTTARHLTPLPDQGTSWNGQCSPPRASSSDDGI